MGKDLEAGHMQAYPANSYFILAHGPLDEHGNGMDLLTKKNKNSPGEKDAKNSRDELAHRVARLLTFNVSLAARLRHTTAISSRPGSGSSAAKTTISVTESPDSPEITPVNVGRPSAPASWPSSSPSPYSGTLANLTTPKSLSRVVLPIELRELRDDFEYYSGTLPSQAGSCEFPTGGVLVGTPYNVTSAR